MAKEAKPPARIPSFAYYIDGPDLLMHDGTWALEAILSAIEHPDFDSRKHWILQAAFVLPTTPYRQASVAALKALLRSLADNTPHLQVEFTEYPGHSADPATRLYGDSPAAEQPMHLISVELITEEAYNDVRDSSSKPPVEAILNGLYVAGFTVGTSARKRDDVMFIVFPSRPPRFIPHIPEVRSPDPRRIPDCVVLRSKHRRKVFQVTT